ncbi:succinate-semialdehyde dehydrogenase [Kineosphaera limosa NBRC 100340]|uniref:Succinate-semialdehyde dehydrogenase n=1 Tax=Kineosphaera limosa NBRC 100340 TaxID=1184609 RepID=K6XEW1_9MICO|nr:succinate-semialdehyde dehydrogenase [Kineosphaera limosa NBRC 100340]
MATHVGEGFDGPARHNPAAEPGQPTAGTFALDPHWVEQLRRHAICSPRAKTMDTITPMTGRVLARLPVSSAEDVEQAYRGARAIQPAWAQLPVRLRAQIFSRLHDLLLDRQGELLDLIQLESGKARYAAFEEVVDAALVCRHYARVAPKLLAPQRRAGVFPGLTRVEQVRHPHGVVGIVAPWNYPLSMALTDAIPALLAGNTVVLRPDPQASLTALLVADLLARAGLPSRVLQIVLGPGPTTGAAVLEHADYVMFTGSTATGRLVARDAGARLIGASLELGGKNPMYVAADADLDRAAEGAVRACFSSAGQLCMSIERLLLHEDIADAFLERFLTRVQSLGLGTNLTFEADMGSLISQAQLDRVEGQVRDALERGAVVLAGGRARPDVGPWFYEPTVLTDVQESMTLCRTETFGPVVAVYRVGSDAEAIARANDTEYGLNASVWTRDGARGRRIAAAIRAGTVNVNEGYGAAYASVDAPMGGMGVSGIGRRHGDEGLLKYTQVQTIATQRGLGLGVPEGIPTERFAAGMTGVLRVMKALGGR